MTTNIDSKMNKFLKTRVSICSNSIFKIALLLLALCLSCKRNGELMISRSYICYPSIDRDRCVEFDGAKFRIIQEIHSLEEKSVRKSNVDSFMQEIYHGPHNVLKIVGKNGVPSDYILYDSLLVNINKKIAIPARMMCQMDSLNAYADLEKKIQIRKIDSLDNEKIQRILHTDYADIPQRCEISNKLQQLKERRNDSLYKLIILEIWSAPGQVKAGDYWSISYRLDMIPRLIFLNNGKSLDYIRKNAQIYQNLRNCSAIDSALKFDIENTFRIKVADTPKTICAKEHKESLPHIETNLMDPIHCGE